MKDLSNDTARVWNIATQTARAGIETGRVTSGALFPNVAHMAHCYRGQLDLLDAHQIALDATREALRQLREGEE